MEAPKGTPGVVVGYDGSEFAVRALDWAADEAELHGRPLTFCHAWEVPYGPAAAAADLGIGPGEGAAHEGADRGTGPGLGPGDRDALRRAAERVAEHGLARARARLPGRPVRIDLHEGPAADRLLELSATAELLVVGVYGRGEVERVGLSAIGRAETGLTGGVALGSPARVAPGPEGGAVPGPGGRVGSVGRLVAARARCPVVIVPGVGAPPASGPVAVGVDGDCGTERLLEFACREAATRHVPLVVVHSWQHHPEFAAASGAYEPTLVRAAAEERVDRVLEPWRLRYPGVAIEVSAAEGPSRQELLEAALDAALLVVGAPHGRCGSMTAFLLHHAPCPVAIVRTQEVDP